jgi:hypothetical protein
MQYFFNLLRYHASTCFGPICSPSLGGRVYSVVNGVFSVLSRLSVGPPTVDLEVKKARSVTLYSRPLDDGLQMGPKHVEAW